MAPRATLTGTELASVALGLLMALMLPLWPSAVSRYHSVATAIYTLTQKDNC